MAETIISQLDRAFANPLETNRQVNFISDRDAISALKRWEGMQVYVKSELTTYELRGGILNEHWTDTSGIDAANYLPTGGYTGTAQDIVDSIELTTSGIEIISVTHIINLDYYVVANPYKINSEYYSASPTTVTLTPGDATDARIDVIYADINGLIGVLEGTPAPSPIKPIVDPNTQRELTFRTVPALATVDHVVTNELVFDENVGTVSGEFDVDGWNLTALDFNNTAVAFSGSKSIYFDGVDPYFNVDFKNDVNIAVSGLSSFYFRVYVTEVLDKNTSFFFHCLDTSFVATGSSRTVKDGLFGFDRNVLNTWQLISIPIAFFNLPVAEIKGIRFMVSSIKKPKMYIDTMAFQYNVTQPDLTPTIYELTSNKKTDIEANKTSNIFYAPIKAFYDWAVGIFQRKLIAGANVTIDNTDPLNPIINASGDGGGVELGETNTTAYRGDRGKIAYDHSQSTHAPNNAQKNSDITKAEIEAKLIGEITSHTHPATGGTGDMVLADVQTVIGEKTFLNLKLGLRNAANTFTSFFTNANTAIRTYTLPNKSMTIAGTDDVALKQNLITGTVNLILKNVGTNLFGDSRLWDTGTFFGIGTVNSPVKDITLGNQGNREIGIEESGNTIKGRDLIITAGRTINYIPSVLFINKPINISVNNYTITVLQNGSMFLDNFTTGAFYRKGISEENFSLVSTAYGMRGYCGDNLNNMYAGAGTTIYKATNDNNTFVNLSQTARAYTDATALLNGDIYFTVNGGDIYKLINGAGDLVALGQTSRAWVKISCSGISNDVFALAGGIVYKQTAGIGDFIQIGQINLSIIAIAVQKTSGILFAANSSTAYTMDSGATTFNIFQTSLPSSTRDMESDFNGNIYLGNYALYIKINDALGTPDLDGGTLINKAGTGKGTGKSRYEVWTGQKLTSGADMQVETLRMVIDEDGIYTRIGTPVYADNAAALAGGLTAGMEYRTATGIKMEVY